MRKFSNSFLLVLTSLFGWAVAAYTLWHHVKVNGQGIAEESFCNVSTSVNCDQVALSRFSEFLGFPVAAWALLFYSALLAFALWNWFSQQDEKKQDAKSSAVWLFFLSLVGLLPTLVLAFVSLLVLKTLCLMCLVTYVVNLVLAVLSWKLFREERAAVGNLSFAAPTWTWVTLGVLLALSWFMPTVFQSSLGTRDLDEKTIAQFVNHLKSQTPKTINTTNSPFLGNPDAKVVITEFSDYQCPFCARSAQTLPLLLKDYLKDVKLVMKNYPLNNACNPNVTGAGHPLACQAAKSAVCVFKLLGNDPFLSFKSTLFKNQARLSRSLIEEEAGKLGVGKDALEACLNSVETNEHLQADISEAKALGVEGTPAVFVNGKLFRGALYPQVFKAAIEELLKEP